VSRQVEFWFVIIMTVAQALRAATRDGVGTRGGYTRVGEKNILFLIETLPKLRFLWVYPLFGPPMT
jgi:hypothetical protein